MLFSADVVLLTGSYSSDKLSSLPSTPSVGRNSTPTNSSENTVILEDTGVSVHLPTIEEVDELEGLV